MSTNLERLKAAYTAWHDTKGASKDVWGAMMADNFRLSHVNDDSPGLSFAKDSMSRAEALKYLSAIFDEWEMVYFRPEHYASAEDSIAMFGKCCFRNKATGKDAEMGMACLWRFVGDKAVSLTEVYDTAVAVKAATG